LALSAETSSKKSSEEILHSLRRYLSIRSVSSPKFSPDGKSVAFISNITGVPRVWMTMIGDGSIDLLSVDDEERVGFLDYAASKDLLMYGIDHGGNERYQINVIENKGETFRRLTDAPKVIHSWGCFSPNGRKLAYASNARNEAFFDVYVQEVESETNSGKLVFQSNDTNTPLCWNPNGGTLLFKRVTDSYYDQKLFLLDENSGDVEEFLPHEGTAVFECVDFSPDAKWVYCLTQIGREFAGIARINARDRSSLEFIYAEDSADVDLLAQSPDGRALAFTVNRDGYSEFKIMHHLSRGAKVQAILTPKGSVITDLDWSSDSKKIAYTLSSSTLNTDVWVCTLGKRTKTERLTRVSNSGITEKCFVEPRIVKCKSFDGVSIASFLYLPKGGKKHPLLVYLHGGPESQFRPTFNPLLQYFLSIGIAVGVPNFRGSSGYGRTFFHLDDVYKRMDTVKDVAAFVSHLKERSAVANRIDFDKVFAFGASYGGFMVLACLYANPDLWAAGVDIVGIANFVTFLKNTGPWRRKLRAAEYGDPDRDYDFLTNISPVSNAEKIRAPLFVIHGVNDPRVPLQESEQIAQTMEKLGREVHIMKFESEGHGLHKVKDRIEGYSEAIQFLLRHV
jgi:dipeptidyl aminopeptidase/acylaminoacyl peptidase